MELKTGLHVGASRETMKIGGIDSPVVRDPITDYPYIPGSSLKGKLRSLWEIANAKDENFFNIYIDNTIKRHECQTRNEAKKCPVCRIFGSATGESPSRIIVRDLHLTEESRKKLENIDTGLKYTEWKFENVIDRITTQATPRQIERIPAGSVFNFEIIYNIEDKEQAKEDLKNLERCLKMLEDDYLGGHGSRGYGKIEIRKQQKIIVKKIEYYLQDNKNASKEFETIEKAIDFIKS